MTNDDIMTLQEAKAMTARETQTSSTEITVGFVIDHQRMYAVKVKRGGLTNYHL